jgi:hypothetical protein
MSYLPGNLWRSKQKFWEPVSTNKLIAACCTTSVAALVPQLDSVEIPTNTFTLRGNAQNFAAANSKLLNSCFVHLSRLPDLQLVLLYGEELCAPSKTYPKRAIKSSLSFASAALSP